MPKILFFHNRHDKNSVALLDRLPPNCEVVDVYAGPQPDFRGYTVRAVPSLAVVSDYRPGEILLLMEEDNIHPELFNFARLVEPPPKEEPQAAMVESLAAMLKELQVKVAALEEKVIAKEASTVPTA